MIEVVAGVLGSAALLLGLSLATIGLYGMLRHPGLFEQLHAAGLVTGPAAILVLVASLASGNAEILTSAVLVVAFILVTASLSTHVIAQAGWQRLRATRDAPDGTSPDVGPTRIVVAHDGSDSSGIAIDLTAALPWPAGTVIRIVSVTEGDLPGMSDIDGRSAAEASPSPVATNLAAAVRALQGPGRRVEHVLRAGDPATAILDEVDALDAQLVVLGSRRQGRLQSLVAGSVVSGVLDGARCPVLVAQTRSARRVLLATDGSDASEVATDAVAWWPQFADAEVSVLSVAAPGSRYRELPPVRTMREMTARSAHRSIAGTAAARIQAAGRRAVPVARIGEPAERIVELAASASSELIVIGSRGHTGLKRTFLGSVAREVLATASASVLVIRSQR